MNQSKLWTKDFTIISLTTFFVALTFYLLMTTLTVYAIEQFHASQSQAGLATGIFVIGALIARLLTGKYMEVIGRKKLLYGSLLLFLIATLLYFPVDNMGLLLVVRFIQGAAFGVSTTAMSTANRTCYLDLFLLYGCRHGDWAVLNRNDNPDSWFSRYVYELGWCSILVDLFVLWSTREKSPTLILSAGPFSTCYLINVEMIRKTANAVLWY